MKLLGWPLIYYDNCMKRGDLDINGHRYTQEVAGSRWSSREDQPMSILISDSGLQSPGIYKYTNDFILPFTQIALLLLIQQFAYSLIYTYMYTQYIYIYHTHIYIYVCMHVYVYEFTYFGKISETKQFIYSVFI